MAAALRGGPSTRPPPPGVKYDDDDDDEDVAAEDASGGGDDDGGDSAARPARGTSAARSGAVGTGRRSTQQPPAARPNVAQQQSSHQQYGIGNRQFDQGPLEGPKLTDAGDAGRSGGLPQQRGVVASGYGDAPPHDAVAAGNDAPAAGGPNSLPPLIAPGTVIRRWEVIERIGAGAFGETYLARSIRGASSSTAPRDDAAGSAVFGASAEEDADANSSGAMPSAPTGDGDVCIKVEKPDKRSVLRTETFALKKAQICPHVVRYISCGRFQQYNYIVMQRMRESLSDCRRRFRGGIMDLFSAFTLGRSALTAIQELHTIGLVHRDIKPSNFVLGYGMESMTCFIIDFGLVRRYRFTTGEVKQARSNAGFRGTTRYASLAAHRHQELGPVDDLWSFLFMLVEFITGTLPWRRVKEKDVIMQLKQAHVGPQLVRSLPRELTQFLQHLMELRYEDTPNYTLLHRLLQATIDRKQLRPPEDAPLLFPEMFPPAPAIDDGGQSPAGSAVPAAGAPLPQRGELDAANGGTTAEGGPMARQRMADHTAVPPADYPQHGAVQGYAEAGRGADRGAAATEPQAGGPVIVRASGVGLATGGEPHPLGGIIQSQAQQQFVSVVGIQDSAQSETNEQQSSGHVRRVGIEASQSSALLEPLVSLSGMQAAYNDFVLRPQPTGFSAPGMNFIQTRFPSMQSTTPAVIAVGPSSAYPAQAPLRTQAPLSPQGVVMDIAGHHRHPQHAALLSSPGDMPQQTPQWDAIRQNSLAEGATSVTHLEAQGILPHDPLVVHAAPQNPLQQLQIRISSVDASVSDRSDMLSHHHRPPAVVYAVNTDAAGAYNNLPRLVGQSGPLDQPLPVSLYSPVEGNDTPMRGGGRREEPVAPLHPRLLASAAEDKAAPIRPSPALQGAAFQQGSPNPAATASDRQVPSTPRRASAAVDGNGFEQHYEGVGAGPSAVAVGNRPPARRSPPGGGDPTHDKSTASNDSHAVEAAAAAKAAAKKKKKKGKGRHSGEDDEDGKSCACGASCSVQ